MSQAKRTEEEPGEEATPVLEMDLSWCPPVCPSPGHLSVEGSTKHPPSTFQPHETHGFFFSSHPVPSLPCSFLSCKLGKGEFNYRLTKLTMHFLKRCNLS